MHADPPPDRPAATTVATLSRRGFLAWSAAVTLAACTDPVTPTIRPSPAASPSGRRSPSPSPASRSPSPAPPSPSASAGAGPSRSSDPAAARRLLFRDAALADGRSDRLRIGVSVLVEGRTIAWIRPSDDEPDPGPRRGLEIVDASGSTIVPGLVDCHSHVTLPGGAHWIDRAFDDEADLLRAAEHNGRLLSRAGVRWARDVGAPVGTDPAHRLRRALSIGVRDRWAQEGRTDFPYIRAAGTWLTRRGTLPAGLGVEADNGDELLAAAMQQLDDGADLVKLYLDGPDASTSPWTVGEVRRVVRAVHDRGARVTAHSGRIAGARAGVAGGVDALEHGFELDADVCADMVRLNTALVSTLAVMRSWRTFARTTTMARFASADGRRATIARLERAEESIRTAHRAGVAIAAGTDFGGGSGRANHLAWEVEGLVRAGLEPWEALGAATWRGGELLGEPEAGVIREGGPADFLLVHGDPTTDPGSLWRVWRVVWAD